MGWIAVGLALMAGALFVGFARRRFRRIRPLQEGAPGRKISDLSPGRFRVVGRIVPIDTTSSGIDGTPCVYVERAEYRSFGSSLVPVMREVAHALVAHPFMIDDGTGRVLIDPKGAVLDTVTLHADEGLTAERRLRAGEEVELVACFRPREVNGALEGPYRTVALSWEATETGFGPPRVTYRTGIGIGVHPADDGVALLTGFGGVLLFAAAFFSVIAML
jgi:hypothetical protein